MAGPKLDGAGTAKLATLEAATNQLQRLHAVVEQCGVAVKGKAPAGPFMPGIRRAAHPLVGLLKGQFGMISDQAAAFLLNATRPGGNDVTRLRVMREGVSQIRVQLELAVAKTLELHTVEGEHPQHAAD
jgi:hypothetical protein